MAAFERKHGFSDKEKKFKGTGGHLKTYDLFHGSLRPPKSDSEPLYTLNDEDYGPYPSLKRLYMEMKDPTEILFAKEYFYSYQHWLACTKNALKDWIEPVREELEILLQAEALQRMFTMADDEKSKNFYQANKLLLDKGWREKEKTTIAAKERIKQQAEELHQLDKEIDKDAALLKEFRGSVN
jgi:hypothetical protein